MQIPRILSDITHNNYHEFCLLFVHKKIVLKDEFSQVTAMLLASEMLKDPKLFSCFRKIKVTEEDLNSLFEFNHKTRDLPFTEKDRAEINANIDYLENKLDDLMSIFAYWLRRYKPLIRLFNLMYAASLFD